LFEVNYQGEHIMVSGRAVGIADALSDAGRREGAEHRGAADTAGALGVPAQRPTRAAAAAANQAMDALHARGDLI